MSPATSRKALGSLLLAIFFAGCAHYEPRPISLKDTADALEGRSLTNAELKKFVSRSAMNRPPSIEEWNLESLAWAAVYYQPSFRLAQAQWKTATAGKLTARSRPNPTVTASPGYDFSATGGANPWIPVFNFDLPIETAGKRGKRMSQAMYLAGAAMLDVRTAAWQAWGGVRTAMIDLWFANQREKLVSSQLTNETTLVRLMEERVSAGAITRNEALPIEIARLKLQTELVAARSEVAQRRVNLAQAVGIPVKALDAAKVDLRSALQRFADGDMSTEEMRDGALQRRTDIVAAYGRYQATQAALQLEIAKQYPDVHFGPAYQWDQGEHKWNLAIGAELPIFNRNQGPIAEAEARRAEAAERIIEIQARIIGEIDQAAAALAAARQELKTASGSKEALGKQVAAARAQFEAGAADQVELTTVVIEESAATLRALDAEMRASVAEAQLENALQLPIWFDWNLPLGTKVVVQKP